MQKLLVPIKGLESLKPIAISDKPIYVSQGFGSNPQIYSRFGMKGHNGLDIAAPAGTPIYASHDGDLRFYIESDGYGKFAKITDKEKETTYGHMSSFEGKDRQVKTGDIIAYVGTTGFSTGNHLHFGLKIKPINNNNGYKGSIDPVPFMENNMNQTKIVVGKDGKTVYKAVPIATDFENFKKQASVEGIEVPSPIPPASTL